MVEVEEANPLQEVEAVVPRSREEVVEVLYFVVAVAAAVEHIVGNIDSMLRNFDSPHRPRTGQNFRSTGHIEQRNLLAYQLQG